MLLHLNQRVQALEFITCTIRVHSSSEVSRGTTGKRCFSGNRIFVKLSSNFINICLTAVDTFNYYFLIDKFSFWNGYFRHYWLVKYFTRSWQVGSTSCHIIYYILLHIFASPSKPSLLLLVNFIYTHILCTVHCYYV